MSRQGDDRKELERRLDQALRMARSAGDTVTRERLASLARELELQLKADDAQQKRVKIEMRIIKYWEMLRNIADVTRARQLSDMIVGFERKLREIDD
jgi:tryptophan 2,3-dioxygenase